MRPQTIEDTIAAISTPPGEGGIGIVRISGGEAIALASRIFVSSKGRDIMVAGGRVFHGTVHDGASVLDEVLLHVMRAPHSYTREDVVEINCHGGMGPLNAVLEAVLRSGARLAEPGEFTKRAFLSGRIDLVQAEAVIDRIRAQTRAGLRAAAAAAGGVLSKSIYEIRDALLESKAQIEAAVDFPDQDVPELVTPALRSEIEAARGRIKLLLDTAEAGRVYREGARVAIAGRPNVGKSTLFNALLRENRALVATSAGTTRDLLEETAVIQGIPVRLSDMAGIRATEDEVEAMGVQRARETLGQAALAIVVYDGTAELTSDDLAIEEEIRGLELPAVKVLNKVDRISDFWKGHGGSEWLHISALKGEGLEALEAELGRLLLGGAHISPDQGMLTRVHQRDSLRRALEHLDRLLAGFEASPEFLSMDLGDALRALGEITGETTPDDVLEHIFSAFCLGK